MRAQGVVLFLLVAGCAGIDDDELGVSTAPASVTWTNLVRVTASGNDLAKTTGAAAWNAGAVSVETLTGDGHVEITLGEVTTSKAAGLSNGDAGQHYSDIDFALRFTPTGRVRVYEAGVFRGTFGTYAAGDRFQIGVVGGVVSYSRSGQMPFYTSTAAPTFPLLVDTAFHTLGGTINDVQLVVDTPLLEWQNVVRVSVIDDDLVKTAGANTWNAGASSLQTLAGDGSLEFVAADNTTMKAAGLSNGDSTQHFNDIDYAVRLTATGVVQVYEAGVLRGSFGSYLAGDRFRIDVDAGRVSYSRDGGPAFYTSSAPVTTPLVADTAFLTPGARLNDFRLVPWASACPAYDGGGLVCSGSFQVNDAADLAAIADCVDIRGSLTINAPGLTEIALPLLERIGSNLDVTGNTAMARLRLPALKEIGGRISLIAYAVTTGIDLSRLRTTGRLIKTNTASVEMAFPCLETSGAIQAGGAGGIARIHVPRLREVPATGLDSVMRAHMFAPRLEYLAADVPYGDVVAPALTRLSGSVSTIESNPPFPYARLDAPNLEAITGSLFDTGGHNLPALTQVGWLRPMVEPMTPLPALATVDYELGDDCGARPVTVVNLPALQQAGDILLCWDELQQVLLPQLETIHGALVIRSAGITGTVELPSLTTVEGGFTTEESLSLPQLVTITAGLTVEAPLVAPALTEIGNNLIIRGSLSADNLSVIDGVLYPRVATVSLPSLSRALRIEVNGGPLTSLSLPSLAQLDAPAGSDAILVANSQLASLYLPSLPTTTGRFRVRDNAALTSLDVPQLVFIGPELAIYSNPVLPNCYATNILDRLQANGWFGNVTISGNGTGTCPP